MDVRRRDLEELRRSEVAPCVSLTLSLAARTLGSDVDRQRLARMLEDAQGALEAWGLPHREATEILAPAHRVADTVTWAPTSRGFTLYAGPGVVRDFELWSPVVDRVVVADRFLLGPLVAELTRSGRFWLLTLTRAHPTLYRGSATGLRPVQLSDELPSFADVVRADVAEPALEYHRAGGGASRSAVTYHGHGGSKDAEPDQTRRWIQALAGRVDELLHGDRAPLVLAGVAEQVAATRRSLRYGHVLDSAVVGSPARTIDVDLHVAAWPLVEARLAQRVDEDRSRFAGLAGTGWTSTVVADVVRAAVEGGVDVLFATNDPPPDDELLVDEAILATWDTGGTVHVLDEPVPGGGSLGAIRRYVTTPPDAATSGSTRTPSP